MAHFVAFCIGFQKIIPLQNPPWGRGGGIWQLKVYKKNPFSVLCEKQIIVSFPMPVLCLALRQTLSKKDNPMAWSMRCLQGLLCTYASFNFTRRNNIALNKYCLNGANNCILFHNWWAIEENYPVYEGVLQFWYLFLYVSSFIISGCNNNRWFRCLGDTSKTNIRVRLNREVFIPTFVDQVVHSNENGNFYLDNTQHTLSINYCNIIKCI